MAKTFQIPTIQEIYDYIIYKQPAWPGSFIQWYSEKFWSHYQASGWRLSSNILMKDWRAAFSSQWKDLRFPADREKLDEFLKLESQKPLKPVIQQTDSLIEKLYHDFQAGNINRNLMASCYKWLKANDFIHFSQEEVNKLVADAGNDKEYGRYLSVKLYFLKRIENERCEYKTGSLNG
jgi:hypothetical protein